MLHSRFRSPAPTTARGWVRILLAPRPSAATPPARALLSRLVAPRAWSRRSASRVADAARARSLALSGVALGHARPGAAQDSLAARSRRLLRGALPPPRSLFPSLLRHPLASAQSSPLFCVFVVYCILPAC
eukprot:136794-Rhodomonas_salina.4